MNSHLRSNLRPKAVIAPAVSRLREVADKLPNNDEGFLQSLISSLSNPAQSECPRCHGSGLLSLRGICEHCLGRGHILAR